jgi:hypothetical protein
MASKEGYLVITKTNELFKEWGAASPYKGLYNAVYMHRDPDTGLFYWPSVEEGDESGFNPQLGSGPRTP